MKKIVILEPLLNSYKKKVLFKSKEPDVFLYRALSELKKIYDVSFYDFKVDDVSYDSILSVVNSCDYLFINVKTYNYKLVHDLLDSINNPKLIVLLYGQLVSSNKPLFKKKHNLFFLDGQIDLFSVNFVNQGKDCFLNANSHNYIKIDINDFDINSIPKLDLSELKKRNYYTIYPLKKPRKNNIAFINLTWGL